MMLLRHQTEGAFMTNSDGLASFPHLFITALLLFSLLGLLAVVKEPGLGISCILGQRGAGGTCISLGLTGLFFSVGAF